MCKALKRAIYDAIDNSKALFADHEIELLAGEIYSAIEPLVNQVQLVRQNQRLYYATKTKGSLQAAIDSEIALDAYLGIVKDNVQLNLKIAEKKS